MDLDETPAIAGISIICPHCGAAEIDDLEVLASDEMHAVACDTCRRRFHLTIAECKRCGEETVLTWTNVPTPAQFMLATCGHCSNRLTDHDDDLRTVGRG